VNIQTNPQSDLTSSDISAPEYIKGKDTFKAADSAKLNGQSAAFYAKDSEMKELRDYDMSAALEAGTEF